MNSIDPRVPKLVEALKTISCTSNCGYAQVVAREAIEIASEPLNEFGGMQRVDWIELIDFLKQERRWEIEINACRQISEGLSE